MSPKNIALIITALILADPALAAEATTDDLTPPIPKQAPATSGLADLGNVKLWYWDTGGTGDVIVLLHPGSGSSEFYAYQQPAFAKSGFRVISYSRRGQFRSELGQDLNSSFAADDLLHLLSYLKVDQCHLVGNALGGYVALDFVISHPGRVRSLVLACSMMGISEPDFTAALRAGRPESFATKSTEERELGPTYRSSCAAGVLEWKTRHERAGRSAPTRLRNKITWPVLAGLRVPILLIAGDDDPYLPPAALRLVADRLPDSRISTIPQAGHAVQWERPDTFNRVVLEFVRSVKSK